MRDPASTCMVERDEGRHARSTSDHHPHAETQAHAPAHTPTNTLMHMQAQTHARRIVFIIIFPPSNYPTPSTAQGSV